MISLTNSLKRNIARARSARKSVPDVFGASQTADVEAGRKQNCGSRSATAVGTKQTFIPMPSMSALRGRADIPDLLAEVSF